MRYKKIDDSVTTVFSYDSHDPYGYRILVNRCICRYKETSVMFYSTYFPGLEIYSKFRPHINIKKLPNRLGKIAYTTDLVTRITIDGLETCLYDISDEDIICEEVENGLIKIFDKRVLENINELLKEAEDDERA